MKDFLIIGLAVLLLLMCMRNKKEQAAMAAAANTKTPDGIITTQGITPGSLDIPPATNSNGGNTIIINGQNADMGAEYTYDAPAGGSFGV